MNRRTVLIEPLDVLSFRGNRLFGDAGSFGEALMPPWPSALAGALRSRMLVDAGIPLDAFAKGEVEHPSLGRVGRPGSFTLVRFALGRRQHDGALEAVMPLPADLSIAEQANGAVRCSRMQPVDAASLSLICSSPLPRVAALAEPERGKPLSGYWLSARGWTQYLAGRMPEARDLIVQRSLWDYDLRIGVGLETARRVAAEGRLFAVQTIAMKEGVGLLVEVAGASEVPRDGYVRLGGDGRSAAVSAASVEWPEPDWAEIVAKRCCRMVLTSPGIFEYGWLPTGSAVPIARGGARFDLGGVRGRIVCAAVPRAQVVSGFDLVGWKPKPAQRAVPAGSVYWLELDEGVAAEDLRKLAERGLWTEEQYSRDMRRAEGFNRVTFAVY